MNKWEKTPESEMKRLENSFLIHSYLYYVLDEPIITDGQYDSVCKDLAALLPFVRPRFPITEQLGSFGSGFYIKTYRPEVISKALLLLYWSKDGEMTFSDFVNLHGFKLK